jgi:hypothetical protein
MRRQEERPWRCLRVPEVEDELSASGRFSMLEAGEVKGPPDLTDDVFESDIRVGSLAFGPCATKPISSSRMDGSAYHGPWPDKINEDR